MPQYVLFAYRPCLMLRHDLLFAKVLSQPLQEHPLRLVHHLAVQLLVFLLRRQGALQYRLQSLILVLLYLQAVDSIK